MVKIPKKKKKKDFDIQQNKKMKCKTYTNSNTLKPVQTLNDFRYFSSSMAIFFFLGKNESLIVGHSLKKKKIKKKKKKKKERKKQKQNKTKQKTKNKRERERENYTLPLNYTLSTLTSLNYEDVYLSPKLFPV